MDAELTKLKIYSEIFVYVFHKLTWEEIILSMLILVWLIGMLMAFIIFPIIFNFFIIPGIEKKVGQKLGYHPYLKLSPFGTYFNRHLEISKYIKERYKALKKYNDHGLPSGRDLFALKKVGYTIDMASRTEIVLSYLVDINLVITVIAFSILSIAAIARGD